MRIVSYAIRRKTMPMNEKLYDFFLDQDSINKYFQLPLSDNLIQKLLLQSQEVDIRNINSQDTLYYVE